jgi:CNT family concentrative nucleoside transporter
MLIDLLRALLGIACLIGLCTLLSENRKAINWKLVGGGMTLQLLLALLFLVVPGGSQAFDALARFFVWITGFSKDGATFVFGPLADPAAERGLGFIFAFQVLPTIIFFSALCSLLYYWGVLQRVVWAFAWVTRIVPRRASRSNPLTGTKRWLSWQAPSSRAEPEVSRSHVS